MVALYYVVDLISNRINYASHYSWMQNVHFSSSQKQHLIIRQVFAETTKIYEINLITALQSLLTASQYVDEAVRSGFLNYEYMGTYV